MTLRVLLVEDNAMNRDLVLAIMEVAGHSVSVAESGAAFRSCLGSGELPDIVLMDVLLPDTDGYTLLRELRANVAFAEVPVVALTAHALAAEIERLTRAGFDAVLTKPIDARNFAATIESYASRGRSEGS